jgi:hypothetical protein
MGGGNGSGGRKKKVAFGSAIARTFKYMETPRNLSKGESLIKKNLDTFSKVSKPEYTYEELKNLLGLLKIYGNEDVMRYFKHKKEELGRFPRVEDISPESMNRLVQEGHIKRFKDEKGRPVSLFHLIEDQIRNEKRQAKNRPFKSLARGESIPVKMLYDRNKTHKVGREKEYLKDLLKLGKYTIRDSNSSATKRRKAEGLARLEANMAERHRMNLGLARLFAKQNTGPGNTRRNYATAKLLHDEGYRRPPRALKRMAATRRVRSASPRVRA